MRKTSFVLGRELFGIFYPRDSSYLVQKQSSKAEWLLTCPIDFHLLTDVQLHISGHPICLNWLLAFFSINTTYYFGGFQDFVSKWQLFLDYFRIALPFFVFLRIHSNNTNKNINKQTNKLVLFCTRIKASVFRGLNDWETSGDYLKRLEDQLRRWYTELEVNNNWHFPIANMISPLRRFESAVSGLYFWGIYLMVRLFPGNSKLLSFVTI